MTDSANHSNVDRSLVVLLWQQGSGELASTRLDWLSDVDKVFRLGSALEDAVIPDVEHEQLEGSIKTLTGALETLHARYPQSDVLLYRVGLQAPEQFVLRLQALMQTPNRPQQIVLPGNYSTEHPEVIDPLLDLGEHDDGTDLDSLVALCGERRWQRIHAVPADCLLIRADMLATHAHMVGQGPAALVDDFYLLDPALEFAGSMPDEAEPPLGHVRLRVSELMQEGIESLPRFCPPQRPVTLHISHSWGGGVWRWIEDHIEGDSFSDHLVLVAVSDGMGHRCGRRLKLCSLGPGRGVIREFELSPDIESTAFEHSGYADHLRQVIDRFGVGRIIVSSLIGHSLECLQTGLPTLQVLHDFYPVWPFLDYDPKPVIEAGQGIDFKLAFERYGSSMRMRPQQAEFWQALTEAWRGCIKNQTIELIAPSQHVIERWQLINPSLDLAIAHEPHGFRPFRTPVEPTQADLEAPLHLLIPGRLTTGKGLKLLEQALPELRQYARITALGCGREAYSLLGQAGIDLILDYQRDELPELIQSLRPHAALLLSTVPETWNYTLSEMRALKLVPIATDVGSFSERIQHGVDGFLIQPKADALVEQVRALTSQMDQLPIMLSEASPERQLSDQADAIHERVSTRRSAWPEYQRITTEQSDQARLAMELAHARETTRLATQQEAEMRAVMLERTDWAIKMDRLFHQRSHLAERLSRDNQQLQSSLVDLQSALVDLQSALADQTELQRQTQQQLEQTTAERERAQDLAEQMMASRSWRITRPLRVFNRLRHSPVLPRLINPLNWPELIAKFIHHWRLRGLKQTLWMLQNLPQPAAEPATVVETLVPQPDQIAKPLSFEQVKQPKVSIIIPVHDQLHFTAACLHSLADVASTASFEVIVVNDASTDTTRRWLKRCRGIQTLTNEQNLDFIDSCNRGAAAACGEYLVFLNNDTQVTDHWLDHMLERFEQDSDTGVVGARLISADGKLQAAGGIIFSDGSRCDYGRNDQADRPQYSFVSEADHVSGACMMLRRELFAELNGFDERYSPASYEDTDLCFRARAQGLKVIYQPAATVVHFKGVTSGTDEFYSAKHRAVNVEKFVQRWQQALVHQPEPLLEPLDDKDASERAKLVRNLRYHRFSRRALVIDAITPTPDQDSGSVRIFALMKLFGQLGFQTSFMPSNRAWSGADSIRLQQAGIEVLTAPWIQDIDDWLATHGAQLDVVLVSRHYVLSPLIRLVRHYCPQASVLFDTVDLHFLREQREAELNGSKAALREAARTRRAELDLVDQADATLVVSEFEAKLLQDLKPESRLQIVSNVHSLQSTGLAWAKRKDLLFVGGFQHPPNRDAAVWLIDEILPKIRAEMPEVKLHLIGSKMPDSLREKRAPGLIVHGFVADLEPYLNTCRVSLAPLRYGAGVKGKVNQAMSHGLPVVATTCAAEGMYTAHEHDVLMADTADDFAAEVVRLYEDQNLWETIATNGRKNVEQHFSVAAAERALSELLIRLEVME